MFAVLQSHGSMSPVFLAWGWLSGVGGVGQPCPAETAAGAALLRAVEGCGCPVAAGSSPTFRTERCPSTAPGTSTGMRGNEFCDESRRGPRTPGAPGQDLGGRVASER